MDILFIDASEEFKKEKNKNVLTNENIDNIIKTYSERKDLEKYAHLADIEEIKENDYNLNIPRYVDTFVEEEPIILSEVADEIKNIDKEIEETKVKLKEMFNELQGTTEEAQKDLEDFMKILNL